MISPTNSAMKLIAQLIRAMQPFMHPSNHGWFQRDLHGAISKLCSIFTARVKLERYVGIFSLAAIWLTRALFFIENKTELFFLYTLAKLAKHSDLVATIPRSL